jgi:hypothetical protein
VRPATTRPLMQPKTKQVPVKRHRGEPGHTRDTHGTRGRTKAHGPRRRTSQPSKPTNNTDIPHVRSSARRPKPRPTQQPQARSRLLNTRYTGTGSGEKTPGGDGTHTGHTCAQGPTDHTDEPHNHRTIPATHQRTYTAQARPHDDRNRGRLNSRSPEPTAPRGRLRKGRPQRIYVFMSE